MFKHAQFWMARGDPAPRAGPWRAWPALRGPPGRARAQKHLYLWCGEIVLGLKIVFTSKTRHVTPHCTLESYRVPTTLPGPDYTKYPITRLHLPITFTFTLLHLPDYIYPIIFAQSFCARLPDYIYPTTTRLDSSVQFKQIICLQNTCCLNLI